ncbi:MAG TPA: hypothetical protein VKY31_14995, partial [Terriglobia bacterium]|nr:hypothetical protein [Terriglobia bacterium]
GKIGIEGTSTIVQKGWEVAGEGGNYRQTKLAFSTPQVFKAFLNSPKAGFVNAISGDSANVKLQDTVRSDQPVQTGPATYVELLLRPGAFLRIDENSSVVLESTTASDVVVRVVSGDALLENVVPEERLQIRVNVGGIKTVVASHGLYRFTSDTASVIDGVIRFGKDGEAVFNGMQVRITDKTYDTTDLKEDSLRDGLDLWSAERARTLARANFISDFADSQPNFFLFLSNRPLNAAWIYSPSAKGITFIPQLKRESYYGDSFVPSSALMPSTSMVGTINVRVPQQQPNLPAVTPAKETPVQPPAKTSK